MHIVDMVFFWARTMPNRPAIIQPDGIVTYHALAHAIEAAAAHFARSILDKDKPVAISMESSVRMLVACLGLLRAGFSIAPIAKQWIEHISSVGANTLVHEKDGITLAGGTNVVFDEVWLKTGGDAYRDAKPIQQTRTDTLDTIFLTSGTTGKPKEIVKIRQAWDQRMLFSTSTVLATPERLLVVPGLTSSYGFTRAYEVLYAGKTACFALFGAPSLWLVNTYDIDMIVCSTQQALTLAEIQEKVTRYPLRALKYLRLGGGRLSHEGAERIKNNLCRNVIVHYGSTEAGATALAFYDAIAQIPDAVGYPIPEVEIEIVDDADRVLPRGSEGIVRLRSTQFIKNFSRDGNASAWFYPGDIGKLTEDGVLCIYGRTGDVVNRGGTKLSITELETELLAYPEIKDAAICSLMGGSGHVEIWVALVFEPSINMIALRKKIDSNERLSGNIDRLFAVNSIPRGEMGKLQQQQLIELLHSIEQESRTSV